MAAITSQTYFEKEGVHPENVEEFFLRGGSPGYAQANTQLDDSAGVEAYEEAAVSVVAEASAAEASQEAVEEDDLQNNALRGGAYSEEYEAEEAYAEEDADGYAETYEEDAEQYAEDDDVPYAAPAGNYLRGGGSTEDEGVEYYADNDAVDGVAAYDDYEEYEADAEEAAEEYEEANNALRGGGSVEDSTGVEEYVTAQSAAEEEYPGENAEYYEEEDYVPEPAYGGYANAGYGYNAYGAPYGLGLRGGASVEVAPPPDQVPVDENGNLIGQFAVPMYDQCQSEPQVFYQVIPADQPTVVSIDADGHVSTAQPNQLPIEPAQPQQISMLIDLNAIAQQMQSAQIDGQTLSTMQGQQQQQQQQPPPQSPTVAPPAPAPVAAPAPPPAKVKSAAPARPKASTPSAAPAAKTSKSGPAAAKAAPGKAAKLSAAPAKAKSKAPAKAAAGSKSKSPAKAAAAPPKGKGKA